MTEEKNIDGIAVDTSSAVKMRRAPGSIISRELEINYMRQVANFEILTQDEELKWTKQYFQNHRVLVDVLHHFTNIIFDCIIEFSKRDPLPRISNFFDIEGSDATTDIRIYFDEMLARMNEIPKSAICFSANKGDARQKPFWNALNPLKMKEAFYAICLEKLNDNDVTPYIATNDWKAIRDKVAQATKNMQQAFKTLTERNLRLVISIASKYMGPGIQLADLVQEGNIGLMKAVEHFDYNFGHRFSTYASYWIRQAITKYITKHCRIIRMPANTVAQISSIKNAEMELLAKNGTPPSDEEIAQATGLTTTNVRTLKKMNQQPISLQSIVMDDSTLEDFVPDIAVNRHPLRIIDNNNLHTTITQLLSELDEREQTVIKMRFGLEDNDIHTFIEISKILNLSSERIRQIEGTALRKLRIKGGPELLEILSHPY